MLKKGSIILLLWVACFPVTSLQGQESDSDTGPPPPLRIIEKAPLDTENEPVMDFPPPDVETPDVTTPDVEIPDVETTDVETTDVETTTLPSEEEPGSEPAAEKVTVPRGTEPPAYPEEPAPVVPE